MKKAFLIGLVLLGVFLVSCAPSGNLSDEMLENDIKDLSDEELDRLIEQSEEENSALAGEAARQAIVYKKTITALQEKVKRLEENS
jgi:hypothetical protein